MDDIAIVIDVLTAQFIIQSSLCSAIESVYLDTRLLLSKSPIPSRSPPT